MFNVQCSHYPLCMKSVLLVDENNAPQGTVSVVDAHSGEGKLHRAYSVFVFRNGGNELLLQQRSSNKALFPLQWANTCCSHPQEDGDTVQAAQQRLKEEMGFTCPLQEAKSFVYRAQDPGRGTEYEYDTILIGNVEGEIAVQPDPAEVADWRWISLMDLMEELDTKPEQFAPWLPEALSHIFEN